MWAEKNRDVPQKLFIQRMSGGLGNQIMEYVFFRFAERRRTEIPHIWDDISYYAFGQEKLVAQFEEIFRIKLNRLAQYYGQDTFEELVRLHRRGIKLPQVLLNCGISISTVSYWPEPAFKGVAVKKPHGYSPGIENLDYRYVYFAGLFNEKCWFMQDREENLKELSFPPLTDSKNLDYAGQICTHMSVGVHVRRGDFLNVNWNIENSSYYKSCETALERYPDSCFFVFSDDLEWCESHAGELGFNLAKNTVYVSGNEPDEKNYIDMQLLSMCRGIIHMGVSTFSTAAAWLDQNLLFEVIIGDPYVYDLKKNMSVTFLEKHGLSSAAPLPQRREDSLGGE